MDIAKIHHFSVSATFLLKVLILRYDYWEVKTAEPRRREDIEKRKLLWEKQHTFSANHRRSLP